MKNRSKFGFLMSTFLILGSVPVQVQGAENTTSSTAKSELLESLDSSLNSTSTTNSSVDSSTSTSSTTESSSEFSSEILESASSDTIESQTTETSAEITSESTEEATTASSTDHEGEELVTRPNRSDLHPSVRQARSGIMTIDPSKNKNTPRLDFIDVSSHNGSISVSQYKSMKKYGVKSVVIKLTEGTSYRNGYAKEQMQNAQLAGLRVHVYHYSWFTTVAKAKEEAAYFVKYAKEIGVPKTAFFINDLEDENIKYATNNHTANSQAFANQIKALGYPNTQHYLGKAWITEGRINAAQLGLSNCWVAQYPYTPTSSQTWNSDYGSWQWSSAVQFPGVSSLFDISIDYSGKLTSYVDDQGPYLSYGKYFTPTSGSYAIYSSFNWTQSDTTKNHLNKTYLAKGMYQHSNGNTYLSLYDNQNKWVGYVDAAAGSVSDNPQGNWMGMKKYVKVNGSYDLYSNFGTTVKNSGSSLKNQVYRATGVYYHFNGNTYYSLYDSANKWMGYIDSRGVETLPDQGLYQNFNQYVSFSAKNQPIYSSFAWHQSANTSTYQNKTYLAKGVYHHLNGKDYYSVYDGADHWLGYVEAGNCQIQSTPGGQWHAYKKYFKVKGNYALYSDFTKTVMHSGDSQKNQQYKATGVYYHFNGNIYYSLYDSANKWMGYIDSRGVEEIPDQGLYHGFNKSFKITQKDQSIYSSFAWRVSGNTTTYLNKTVEAAGVYHHMNGKDYYSLYQNGKWIGYVEASVGKVVK